MLIQLPYLRLWVLLLVSKNWNSRSGIPANNLSLKFQNSKQGLEPSRRDQFLNWQATTGIPTISTSTGIGMQITGMIIMKAADTGAMASG
jgi:hypothetical protein